jgi:hypothetical protein
MPASSRGLSIPAAGVSVSIPGVSVYQGRHLVYGGQASPSAPASSKQQVRKKQQSSEARDTGIHSKALRLRPRAGSGLPQVTGLGLAQAGYARGGWGSRIFPGGEGASLCTPQGRAGQ